jgi:hypothetical protein
LSEFASSALQGPIVSHWHQITKLKKQHPASLAKLKCKTGTWEGEIFVFLVGEISSNFELKNMIF